MQPAEDRLAADLATIVFATPGVPVVCNVDAAPVLTGDAAREALVRQVTGAVRWVECVRALQAAGVTRWIEVGPGKVLTGLSRSIDRALAAQSAATQDGIEKIWGAPAD